MSQCQVVLCVKVSSPRTSSDKNGMREESEHDTDDNLKLQAYLKGATRRAGDDF